MLSGTLRADQDLVDTVDKESSGTVVKDLLSRNFQENRHLGVSQLVIFVFAPLRLFSFSRIQFLCRFLRSLRLCAGLVWRGTLVLFCCWQELRVFQVLLGDQNHSDGLFKLKASD